MHTHMCTPSVSTQGCFLSQLCGGQASSHLAEEEGQSQPDGSHLCLITTHQDGWTQPQHSET